MVEPIQAFQKQFNLTSARFSKLEPAPFTIKKISQLDLSHSKVMKLRYDYANHYNKKSLTINNLNEVVVITASIEGVSSTYYLMKLVRQALKTNSDLLEDVKKQIGVEEMLKGRDLSGLSTLLPSSKSDREHKSIFP